MFCHMLSVCSLLTEGTVPLPSRRGLFGADAPGAGGSYSGRGVLSRSFSSCCVRNGGSSSPSALRVPRVCDSVYLIHKLWKGKNTFLIPSCDACLMFWLPPRCSRPGVSRSFWCLWQIFIEVFSLLSHRTSFLLCVHYHAEG